MSSGVPPHSRPSLAGPIGAWELFPGTHVVGIRELDRYLRVPSAKVGVVLEALSRMDGNRSLDEIGESLRAAGWTLDMADFHRRLVDAGLIAGVPFSGDMTRLFVPWAGVRIDRFFKDPSGARWAYLLARWACLLAVPAALAAMLWSGALWPQGRPDGGAYSLRVSDVLPLTLGVILSIVLHEGAHLVTAWAHGLVPARLRFVGFLGFIPYAVLFIPGLYTVPPRIRVKIWSAGPLGSLTAASLARVLVAFLPAGAPASVWLAHFAIANMTIVVWNLCPLLPTDGYFVFCTLLKRHNLRRHAWQELFDSIRHARKPHLLLACYGAVSVALLALVWGRNVVWLLHWAASSVLGVAVLLVAVALLVRQAQLAGRRKHGLAERES